MKRFEGSCKQFWEKLEFKIAKSIVNAYWRTCFKKIYHTRNV